MSSTDTPDFSLASGYVEPDLDAVNFVVGLPGADSSGGGSTSSSPALYITVAASFAAGGLRASPLSSTLWGDCRAVTAEAQAEWAKPSPDDATLNAPANFTSRMDESSGDQWSHARVILLDTVTDWAKDYPSDRASAPIWRVSNPSDNAPESMQWGKDFPADNVADTLWVTALLPSEQYNTKTKIQRFQPQPALYRIKLGDRLLAILEPLSAPVSSIDAVLASQILYAPKMGAQLNFGLIGSYMEPAIDAVDFALYGIVAYQPSLQRTLSAGYSLPAQNYRIVGQSDGLRETLSEAVIQSRHDPAYEFLPWGAPRRADQGDRVAWGPLGLPVADPPPTGSGWTGSPDEPPPVPTPMRVYIIMNDVSVVRMPDGTPIEVTSVDLSASLDSWAWSVSMELADPAALSLLKPDGNGPKVVQITMNGYIWTAIIENWDASRAFAQQGVTVSGRSQTALISADYIATRSKSFEQAYSAQQLANLELTDRALPFTITWTGLDWLVPSGAWYYQDMAPIDVIAQIAAARGGVLQSDPSAASLIVNSRYPNSPWAWNTASSDIVLPSDWAKNMSSQQQTKPMVDAVIVAGQSQGVLAKVSRSGEAGETYAPQVVDQLIVTPDVAQERGRNILGDRGMQALVSMQIPLFPMGTYTAGMSGLYTPLLLVDFQDSVDPFFGQAASVTISARRAGNANKALEIWQNVSLERHLSDAN